MNVTICYFTCFFMLDIIFNPDTGLDWWSLFHVLLGIVVGFGVQNTNHKKVLKLHTFIADEFVSVVGRHIKKLPKKIRKLINIEAMVQPLWHQFDIHSVLMVAFFRETLEMYLEQGQIIP